MKINDETDQRVNKYINPHAAKFCRNIQQWRTFEGRQQDSWLERATESNERYI